MKLFLMCLSLFVASSLMANEGVCPRCVKIREENAKKPPNPYEYYEDYLKAKESGAVEDETEQKLY